MLLHSDFSLAPQVGLEPTTLRLTVACSTGWAIEEYKSWRLPIVPGRCQPSIVGTNELNFRVRDGNGWTLIVIDTNYSILVVLTGDSHIIAQDIWKCKRFFQFFWKIFYKIPVAFGVVLWYDKNRNTLEVTLCALFARSAIIFGTPIYIFCL